MITRIEAIEDNAGGLHIAVIDGDTCAALFSGFECAKNSRLTAEMTDAWENGTDSWESLYDDPNAEYENLTEAQYGHKVIADYDGDVLSIYPRLMGAAGKAWLNG